MGGNGRGQMSAPIAPSVDPQGRRKVYNMPSDDSLAASEDSHPRLPMTAPQHPKNGHQYFDRESETIQTYVDGVWYQTMACRS